MDEFPAEWEDDDIPPDDGGETGQHGVYGDEMYQPDEIEAGEDFEEPEDPDRQEDFEEPEPQEYQDQEYQENCSYEDVQEFDVVDPADPPDEFEEVAEELEDPEALEAEHQAEQVNGGHPWDSPKSKSSRAGKRNRAGRKVQAKKWKLEQKKQEEQQRSRYQGWSEKSEESSSKWSQKWKRWGTWGKSKKGADKDHKDSWWTQGKSKKGADKDHKDSWWTQGKSEKGSEKEQKNWWTPESQVEAGEGSAASRPRNLHKGRKFDQTSDSHGDWQEGSRQVDRPDPSKVVHPWRAEASSSQSWESQTNQKGNSQGKPMNPPPPAVRPGVQVARGGLQSPGSVPRGLQRTVSVPLRGLQGALAAPPGNTPRGFQAGVQTPRPGGRRPIPVTPPPPPQGRQPVATPPPGNMPRGFQAGVQTPRPGGNLPRSLQPGVQPPRLGGRTPAPVRPPQGARNGTAHVVASPKRPRDDAAQAAPTPAAAGVKRLKTEPQASEAPQPQEEQEETSTKQTKTAKMKIILKPGVAQKVKQLNARGIKLTPEALRSVADADPKEVEILLQALLKRGEVPNPSKFVTASLDNLAKMKADMVMQAAMEASEEQTPTAQSPAPVAPPAQRLPRPPPNPPPAAQVAKVPGQGQRPRPRPNNLPFERLAVQAKLFAVNKKGIWAKQGKALDESALACLMQIEPARSLEILDEVEAQGVGLADPSRYVRELAAEEEQIFPPC